MKMLCEVHIGRLSEVPEDLTQIAPAPTDAVVVHAHGAELRFLLLELRIHKQTPSWQGLTSENLYRLLRARLSFDCAT